jgi:6-pyruvoyltetrahydropterin/6-carboxytetrahydropterin synthase
MNQINKVFELSQNFYFEAAHTLNRSYESEGSKKIHGHTFHAEITITGTPEIESGMILDIAILKNEITRIRNILDHSFLDELNNLGPATLENLCEFIRLEIQKTLPNLSKIIVERKASGDKCTLHINK